MAIYLNNNVGVKLATNAPYGLRPINRNDGMPYAGATSQYLINPTSGAGTNLFYGQVVLIDADGYIALSTATGADLTTNNLGGSSIGAWGVFVGASYINSQGQQIYGQYYPSGTTGVVTAYVITDPNVTFQAQLDGQVTQAALGANTFFAAAQSTSKLEQFDSLSKGVIIPQVKKLGANPTNTDLQFILKRDALTAKRLKKFSS